MQKKELNLTQGELADKLYVLPTTISKWERGVSYPDITMVNSLCKELNISEREIFIACDDNAINEIKKRANKYTRLTKVIRLSLIVLYVLGIITCFICNLAIEKRLSWFYIILNSFAISFIVTNGAFCLKELKVKNYKMISLFIITILVYILLFVCNLYTKGNWLLTVAYPVATFVFLLLWLSVGLIYKLKSNKYINCSIVTFTTAVAVLFTNPLLELLTETKTNATQTYNVISGIILLITSMILLVLGVLMITFNKGENK